MIFRLGLAVLLVSLAPAHAQTADDATAGAVAAHQYDLRRDGFDFLVNEAARSDFFLLGELHGDRQIPDLMRRLWPALWRRGYRHVAAELSPWAAYQLEVRKRREIRGLWTAEEAATVHAPAAAGETVLWGCDMEEIQPDLLIRALARLNPNDRYLRQMVSMTGSGYSRAMATRLLALAQKDNESRDQVVNGISLRKNLLTTLQIENDRLDKEDKLIAQNEREQLMKRQFMTHFKTASRGKVLLRFGRNHMHRGYDARGVSTLGNFIAELATGRGRTAFNVGAFGAGGKATLLGERWDADERKDEPAFALLAAKAKYAATVFDLRPLRPLLHRIPAEKRSPLQQNLIYWADSYDALICYQTVTPREP